MTVVPARRSLAPILAPTLAPTPPAKPDPGPRAPLIALAPQVSIPIPTKAPGQIAASTALAATRLAERDETNHPAAEARIAAEAARKAYIKASLAAGVSPLPMP